MGKDNIVFHTVIWPSMLLGYGRGRRVRRGARRAQASRQRRVERVPHDGGQEVQLEPRRPDPRPRLPRAATTPMRFATSSRSPAPRRRTPTSRGPSSSVATTTSSSRPGATSSTERFRAPTRTSAPFRARGRSRPRTRRCSARSREGSTPSASLIEAARFRSALQEAMRLAALGNQYVAEQAPWAKLEVEPRAGGDDPVRRASRRRQPEGPARAVPPVLGAAAARACSATTT